MITMLALLLMTQTPQTQQTQQWPQHSLDRPRPPVVDPGPERPSAPAPKDAIVLFDGKDLSQWRAEDSNAAKWTVRDGYVEVKPATGMLVSARGFGDVQLHIEWATPAVVQGESQERGNSGIFLMGIYELQVLDSYQNDTSPTGKRARSTANPPLVNVKDIGEYDVVFRRPQQPTGRSRGGADDRVLNGVLIQGFWWSGRPLIRHGRRIAHIRTSCRSSSRTTEIRSGTGIFG
jgi:hypothetical protein